MDIKKIIELLKNQGAVTHEDILDALCDGEFLNNVGITDIDIVEDTYNMVMEEKHIDTILCLLK